jgi:hypothetical protein
MRCVHTLQKKSAMQPHCRGWEKLGANGRTSWVLRVAGLRKIVCTRLGGGGAINNMVEKVSGASLRQDLFQPGQQGGQAMAAYGQGMPMAAQTDAVFPAMFFKTGHLPQVDHVGAVDA